jgi:hypothetical protein
MSCAFLSFFPSINFALINMFVRNATISFWSSF